MSQKPRKYFKKKRQSTVPIKKTKQKKNSTQTYPTIKQNKV